MTTAVSAGNPVIITTGFKSTCTSEDSFEGSFSGGLPSFTPFVEPRIDVKHQHKITQSKEVNAGTQTTWYPPQGATGLHIICEWDQRYAVGTVNVFDAIGTLAQATAAKWTHAEDVQGMLTPEWVDSNGNVIGTGAGSRGTGGGSKGGGQLADENYICTCVFYFKTLHTSLGKSPRLGDSRFGGVLLSV